MNLTPTMLTEAEEIATQVSQHLGITPLRYACFCWLKAMKERSPGYSRDDPAYDIRPAKEQRPGGLDI